MTICIAMVVPDGIALAADTQISWNKTITKAINKDTGEEFELQTPIEIPMGWSKMAKKLFPLTFGGVKYAACIAGSALLNSKTMYAIFKSLEKTYDRNLNYNDIINYYIEGIKNQLRIQYNIENISEAPTSFIEFILAGYQNQDPTKPIIESHLIFSGNLNINGVMDSSGHILRWSNRDNTYNACWIGETEIVSHIVNHNNDKLPPISGQYQLMTLSAAVDYTKFLVEFTCDFQRFAVMVPDCGRPIVCATLTPEEYIEKVYE